MEYTVTNAVAGKHQV